MCHLCHQIRRVLNSYPPRILDGGQTFRYNVFNDSVNFIVIRTLQKGKVCNGELHVNSLCRSYSPNGVNTDDMWRDNLSISLHNLPCIMFWQNLMYSRSVWRKLVLHNVECVTINDSLLTEHDTFLTAYHYHIGTDAPSTGNGCDGLAYMYDMQCLLGLICIGYLSQLKWFRNPISNELRRSRKSPCCEAYWAADVTKPFLIPRDKILTPYYISGMTRQNMQTIEVAYLWFLHRNFNSWLIHAPVFDSHVNSIRRFILTFSSQWVFKM